MGCLRVIGTLLVGLGPVCGVAEEFRIFTAADGRVIEGRLKDYNSTRKQLQFERPGGKKIWVKPAIFSEEDQSYIKEWIIADEFMSATGLRISIQKKKDSVEGKSRDSDIHFEVSMQNRSSFSFDDLNIDYRIYIDEQGYNGMPDRDRCMAGKIEVGAIGGGDRKQVVSAKERLRKIYERYTVTTTEYDAYGYSYTSTSTEERKKREDKLQGILMRISGPKVEGKSCVRELSFPTDFFEDVIWVETPAKKVSVASSSGNQSTSSNVIKEAEKYLKGKDKDPLKALALLTASFQKNPNGAVAAKIGGICLHSHLRDFALAEEWMQKAADCGNSFGPNGISMFYSCNKTAKFRNGPKAVKFGLLAVEIVGKEYWVLDTLACAYARNAQFDLAVETQERAYKLAKKRSVSEKSLKGFQTRLEHFKQGQAWDGTMKQ